MLTSYQLQCTGVAARGALQRITALRYLEMKYIINMGKVQNKAPMIVPNTGEKNRKDLISSYLIDNYEGLLKRRETLGGYTGITTDL